MNFVYILFSYYSFHTLALCICFVFICLPFCVLHVSLSAFIIAIHAVCSFVSLPCFHIYQMDSVRLLLFHFSTLFVALNRLLVSSSIVLLLSFLIRFVLPLFSCDVAVAVVVVVFAAVALVIIVLCAICALLFAVQTSIYAYIKQQSNHITFVLYEMNVIQNTIAQGYSMLLVVSSQYSYYASTLSLLCNHRLLSIQMRLQHSQKKY